MRTIIIKTEQVVITPSMAIEMLKASIGNRKMDLNQLKQLIKIIGTGNWLIQPSGISFDYNGVLIDGHTRLTAIIKSGQPTEMLVQYGFDPRVRSSIDTGKSKTVANGLEMLNLGLRANDKGKLISYAKQISQLATYVMLHTQNNTSVCNGRGGLTNAEVIDFVELNDNENDLIDSVIKVKELLKGCNYMTESYFSFLYQMHKENNEPKILDFINIVAGKQESVYSNCSAKTLRTLLDKNKNSAVKLRTIVVFGYVMDACNKFINDEDGKKLNFVESTKGEIKLKV